LTHGLQPPLNAHALIHGLLEIIIQRIDGPGDTGSGEGLDQVQIPKDEVAFGGNTDFASTPLHLLEDGPGALVLGLVGLIRIRHGTQEQFLAFVFGRILDIRPGFHIHESAPRLRMVGEAFHKGSITVFAGVKASYIGIHGVVRNGKVGLGKDCLDFYLFDIHRCYSFLVLRYWSGVTP